MKLLTFLNQRSILFSAAQKAAIFKKGGEKRAMGGRRGRVESLSTPTETRTTRDRILDILRSKSEWGIDLGVFEEIIDWGLFGLIKKEGEIIGFSLGMERPEENIETNLIYFHPEKKAEIWWQEGYINELIELQNVRNIRVLKVGLKNEEVLYLEGEHGKENPWGYEISWKGYIRKHQISLQEWEKGRI